jgi:ketosteroid isomerase-like protein
MSQENVEIVRRWFERLASGDPAPEFCDPEMEIRNWPESPLPGPYRGHEGVRRWFAEVKDMDIVSEIEMFDLVDVIGVDAERVVTVLRAHSRARYTGLEADFLWGAVHRVRDGKVVSSAGYPTPEAAKEAAGLEE